MFIPSIKYKIHERNIDDDKSYSSADFTVFKNLDV